MENLGQKIRKRREELGLKVYELADKVGVDPVYITQIEKHNKFPSIDVFQNIQKALKTDFRLAYVREKHGDLYDMIGALLPPQRPLNRRTLWANLLNYTITREFEDRKDHKAYALYLLNEFNPSQIENQKLVNEIISRLGELKSTRQKLIGLQNLIKSSSSPSKQ